MTKSAMAIRGSRHRPSATMFLVTERTGNVARDVGLMQQMARVTFLAGLIQGRHLARFRLDEFLDSKGARRGVQGRENHPARPQRTCRVTRRATLIPISAGVKFRKGLAGMGSREFAGIDEFAAPWASQHNQQDRRRRRHDSARELAPARAQRRDR